MIIKRNVNSRSVTVALINAKKKTLHGKLQARSSGGEGGADSLKF